MKRTAYAVACVLFGVLTACAASPQTNAATTTTATLPIAPSVVPATTALLAPPTTIATTNPVAPVTAKVIAEWKVSNPSFIAFGFGSVWVTDHYGHNITRIDPVSNKVIAVIRGIG